MVYKCKLNRKEMSYIAKLAIITNGHVCITRTSRQYQYQHNML